MGEDLKFRLSLGLFSSGGVDSGTKLLLKTLARQDAVPGKGCVLDAGCGAGIIAVSLKKKFPQLEITASDRDALALQFTAVNSSLNRLAGDGIILRGGLLPGSLAGPFLSDYKTGSACSDCREPEGKFDLIVSNIPAKAGNPVIKDFLTGCGRHLNPGGAAAVVIVAPLADFAAGCLEKAGAEIGYREDDSGYSVFHFRPSAIKDAATGRPAELYLRDPAYTGSGRRDGFPAGFHGLPEFDTASYSTITALKVLPAGVPDGRLIFWNPGTGIIPMELLNRAKKAPEDLIYGSRDLLQLTAADYNTGQKAKLLHLPRISSIKDQLQQCSVDLFAVQPVFISGADIENELTATAEMILKPSGRLLVSSRSTDIARIEKQRRCFRIISDYRYRGFRALLMEKPA